MHPIDRYCHICLGYFTRDPKNIKWKRCNCGVRRMEKEVISLYDYITSSGKNPDLINHLECTVEAKDKIVKMLNQVNIILSDLKIKEVKIIEGYKP